MTPKKIMRLLIFVLLLLLIPCLSFGQQFYDIETGTNGTFGYSYIHSATTPWGSDSDFKTGGSLLLNIDGFLEFSISGTNLNISDSTLTAVGIGTKSGNWTLDIFAGTLNLSATQGTPAGGSLMGTLDYTLDKIGASDTLEHSGTFYFYNNQFNGIGGATQTVSSTELFLWANNWQNKGGTEPATNAIGIDLGSTTVVPEPISSALFIAGGATLGFRRFRKKFKK